MTAPVSSMGAPPDVAAGHGRVLVAGIGNIFFGDDAFGVEVVRRLADRPLHAPRGDQHHGSRVKVADFGIRSMHLAYELLDGYELLVLVDAMPLGEAPGTVALFEPDRPTDPEPDADGPGLDAHTMSPAVVLGTLAALGGSIDRVLVVGCQPAQLDQGIGLSDVVAASVAPAMALIEDVLADSASADEPSEVPT